jgi:MGT family glycosyltransferase
VPILQELLRRGHAVTLHTLASQVELARGQGIEAVPLASSAEAIELDDYKRRTQLGKGRRALAVFVARAEHDAADLAAGISDARPDILLVDCLAWGACAVAQASGLPWAQYLPFPLPQPSSEVPPFGLGLRPARGPLGRRRDAALRVPAALAGDWRNLSRLNMVRAGFGAPTLAHLTDLYTLAPLVLHLTAEPFEYRRPNGPRCLRMVGPCAWDPPGEPPAWLAELQRPLILISTSSERQDDRRLVATAIAAFAGRDFELLATLPAAGVAGLEAPANVHLEPFLSHRPLLAAAACAITHGGAGVTQKALLSGVPVCVVPFGRDQREVARRVEAAGVGTRLAAARLTPRRLRAKVEEAITMRAAAQAVGDALQAAGGPVGAADALVALMR